MLKNPFKGDSLGVHFALNIFIAATFLWLVLRHLADLNPIWAVSSMVAASDPKPRQAATFFYGRLVNALAGHRPVGPGRRRLERVEDPARSRNKFKTNADGSVDLYIQRDSPGKDKQENWLPAPSDTFVLVMRLYWPSDKTPSILDDTWKPPLVKEAS